MSAAAKATDVEQLDALLKKDLRGQTGLRHASIQVIQWMLARRASAVTIDTTQIPFQHSTTKYVDDQTVQRFRADVEQFLVPGHQSSADADRTALITYLVANIKRLARGEYSERVGWALFSGIAEATLLLTWLTFDVAPTSALTQRYSIHARELAHRGGDRLLEAAALAAMSAQARHVGLADEAANLATAARTAQAGIRNCPQLCDGVEPAAWRTMLGELRAARLPPEPRP